MNYVVMAAKDGILDDHSFIVKQTVEEDIAKRFALATEIKTKGEYICYIYEVTSDLSECEVDDILTSHGVTQQEIREYDNKTDTRGHVGRTEYFYQNICDPGLDNCG